MTNKDDYVASQQGPATYPLSLVQIAEHARNLIAAAERDGVVIDDGNVVDLIADHVDASLTDIRTALVVAGFSARFSRAIGG